MAHLTYPTPQQG